MPADFDDNEAIVGFDRTVTDKGGLAATGLRPREMFCAEPIVSRSTPPVQCGHARVR